MDLCANEFLRLVPNQPVSPTPSPLCKTAKKTAQTSYDSALKQIKELLEDGTLPDEICLREIEKIVLVFEEENTGSLGASD